MDITPATSGKRRRPPKFYENLSKKSKKRKYYNAYIQGLRSGGEFEEASVVEILRE